MIFTIREFSIIVVWIAGISHGVVALAQQSGGPSDQTRQDRDRLVIDNNSIDADSIAGHIRFLADDLLEGRGPGTRGDEITQLYIATQFQSLGLTPAFVDQGRPSWKQHVPLVGVKTVPPPTVDFVAGETTVTLANSTDVVSVIGRPAESASIRDAELVFVGYGIVAPQYDWDDYGDADLSGKILVMLNNDPDATDRGDPELFEGKRRLYYGRWDYKYEMAAKMGAAGAIIIHTTESAGYPWQVIQTSWSGTEFDLDGDQKPKLQWEAWTTYAAMESIVQAGGHQLGDLIQSAQLRSFEPVPLGIQTSVDLKGQLTRTTTANVAGFLPGSDPDLRDEHVLLMAHHDHLGIGQRDATGDGIYNGAVDNASGVAMLLSMAAALRSQPPSRRSIMFVTVGAEEQGLLGSKTFAADPPIPAGKMAALINIDGMNTLGRTHDVNVIGYGKSSLDDVITRVAKRQQRIVTPDSFPDRGYYYRSDQFSLAKIGVPAVYLHTGTSVRGKQPDWGKSQLEAWTENVYHQPCDEYDQDWNLDGAVEDAELLLGVALDVANTNALPAWTAGDEFEAVRIESLQSLQSLQSPGAAAP